MFHSAESPSSKPSLYKMNGSVSVPFPVPVPVIRYPDKSNLREKWFVLPFSSIAAGKSQRYELEIVVGLYQHSIKSTYCYFRGPGFDSQYLYFQFQWIQCPLLGLGDSCMYMVHRKAHRHTHIKIVNKPSFKKKNKAEQ